MATGHQVREAKRRTWSAPVTPHGTVTLCAVVCLAGFFAAATPVQAFQLITPEEAALPGWHGSRAWPARSSPTRRPNVIVISPPPNASLVHSPVDVKLQFRAFGGAQIDQFRGRDLSQGAGHRYHPAHHAIHHGRWRQHFTSRCAARQAPILGRVEGQGRPHWRSEFSSKLPNKASRTMPKIAISYRRSNSAAITGRIFDHLTEHYGEASVFMDIDNIPYGIDFRTHIRDTLRLTDLLIAVIGANWLGVNATGTARMAEETDPVRVEIETALARPTPIIPVLVEGAKMPDSTALPPEFGNFAFLNAAEVTSGRDFRNQMERLIGAIDRTLAPGAFAVASSSTSGEALAVVADIEGSPRKYWLTNALRYFLVPLIFLLVVHHVIVNALDLNTEYLWIASAIVPIVFGFALFWFGGGGGGPATVFAIGLGLIGVVGMTISESLSCRRPDAAADAVRMARQHPIRRRHRTELSRRPCVCACAS